MNDLAGALQLRPGVPVPHSLHSSRQAWAARLAPGHPAEAWPGLLASLFSLCGHAHRTASQLAIQAVEPGRFPAMAPVAATLQRETALDHLRRIALDWPRLLAEPGQVAEVSARAADGLRRCPLIASPLSPNPWPALHQWLQDEWLQMRPATWLRAWRTRGADWLDDWSRRHPGWLPALLRSAREADTPLPGAHEQALRPHAAETSLRVLGAAVATGAVDVLQPRWEGRPACTGVWSRLHDVAPNRPWTAWSLLGSRLAELVRLSLPDAPGEGGAGWLAWGALATGPRQGLAWVEMARGLLIHQVTLEDTPAGQPCRLRAAQVLAPTEWNFHRAGVVAQALAALPAAAPDLHARVRLLMAAIDPCVPFEIAAPMVQDVSLEV